MISAEHRAIVSSTVPLLEQGGEALTTHFYRILLDEHPEVRPYFNQANQATGEQPRALANGVLVYARHIERLEALGNLVGEIISKHVSLRIRREHYPVVGASLLRAIREVLGADIATDAVLEPGALPTSSWPIFSATPKKPFTTAWHRARVAGAMGVPSLWHTRSRRARRSPHSTSCRSMVAP